MDEILLEVVKASLAAGLSLLAAWLQRRKDLRDIKSGKKDINNFRNF